MIRFFYDLRKQGIVMVHEDTTILLRDDLHNLCGYFYDRMVLYSDRIEPPLEELFSDEYVHDEEPYWERATESDYPWEWKGTVKRTHERMKTFAEHPETVIYRWYESENQIVREMFYMIAEIVTKREGRQQPRECVDGPCAGYVANIDFGETRTFVDDNYLTKSGTMCRNKYVYELGFDDKLHYIRTQIKTETPQKKPLDVKVGNPYVQQKLEELHQ